jgi:hypothetical protein
MTPRRRSSAGDPALDGLGAARDAAGREHVSDIQRARMLSAMVEIATERGALKDPRARELFKRGEALHAQLDAENANF